MKKTDNGLHQLILGLSGSEKRYFQLFATRHFPKNSQYLRLFKAIAAQPEYDETALTQAFARGRSGSYLAVLKNQLYDALLEALHLFESYDDKGLEITKGVHYCQILLNRGMYDACALRLKRYKKMAYALEKFEELVALIGVEKKLEARKQFSGSKGEKIQELADEELRCLRSIETNNAYWLQAARTYHLHVAGTIAPGKIPETFTDLVHTEAFSGSDNALTLAAKLDRLQVLALYAFVSGNTQSAYTINRNFLQIMDQHPHLRQANAPRYISTLNNYLIDCLILEQHDAMFSGIQTLRALPAQKAFRAIPNVRTQVFRMSHQLLLNYFIGKEQFADAVAEADTMLSAWKDYNKYLSTPQQITLLYLAAYCKFCSRQFSACLDLVRSILHMRDADRMADLYADIRMLQILAHFEHKDILLIDSLIISFQRHTENRKLRTGTYQAVLRYLRSAVRNPDKPVRNALEHRLLVLSKDEGERKVFNNFNYLYWLRHVSHMR